MGFNQQKGASGTEHGLLFALIAVLLVGVLSGIGQNLSSLFTVLNSGITPNQNEIIPTPDVPENSGPTARYVVVDLVHPTTSTWGGISELTFYDSSNNIIPYTPTASFSPTTNGTWRYWSRTIWSPDYINDGSLAGSPSNSAVYANNGTWARFYLDFGESQSISRIELTTAGHKKYITEHASFYGGDSVDYDLNLRNRINDGLTSLGSVTFTDVESLGADETQTQTLTLN